MTIRTRGWMVCALTLTMAVPAAWAQAPAAKPPAPADKPAAAAGGPGVVIAEARMITATVESIDTARRVVTLKGPDGRSVTLKVGPNAKNFDQVKVGDKVTFRFLDSIALFVRKAGEPADAAEMKAVSVAPLGKKPMGVAVDTLEISAKVEKIDLARRLITVKGPEGNTRTLRVDRRVKRLDQIKVGDDIVVRHTEAVAIEVMAPKP